MIDDADPFEAALTLSQRAMGMRAAAPADTRYLDDLNPAQRAAVLALDGPVLMLAGAGTGKTKALTARIVHLLRQHKARPNEILAVTFTNKAAREMKSRVGRMLGEVVEGMPLAGHLPLAVGENPPPSRRTGRAEVELHHSGHRRPAAAAETADRCGQYRRKALARPPAGRDHRRLEEPRADARPGAFVRSRGLQQPRHRALRTVSGPPAQPERDGFRRPAAALRHHLPDPPRCSGPVSALVPLYSGG